MSIDFHHRGHCRCGSIVMMAKVDPDFSVYCHCDDCRRATGAPVLASIGFWKKDVEWILVEEMGRYVQGTAARLFCKKCGTPIAQEHESAIERIFINTGFMDNPAAFPPKAHTFAGAQLPWLELADNLDRHEKTLLIKA